MFYYKNIFPVHNNLRQYSWVREQVYNKYINLSGGHFTIDFQLQMLHVVIQLTITRPTQNLAHAKTAALPRHVQKSVEITWL